MRSPPCPAGAARLARIAPRGGVGRWRAPIDPGICLIADTVSDESPGPPNAPSAKRNRSASSERSSRWRSMAARSSSTLTSTRAYPVAPTTRPSSLTRGPSRGRAEAAPATRTPTAGGPPSSRSRSTAAALPRTGGVSPALASRPGSRPRDHRTGRETLRHATDRRRTLGWLPVVRQRVLRRAATGFETRLRRLTRAVWFIGRIRDARWRPRVNTCVAANMRLVAVGKVRPVGGQMTKAFTGGLLALRYPGT